MFTVRIVGVDEERVVALASVRRNKKLLDEVVVAAGGVVAEKQSFAEEREKRCNHHVRWFDGFLWWR